MSTVLITGASRGIGLEFARQYTGAGWRVYATCRSPERAQELSRLAAASRGTISVHPLDVTDPRHIEAVIDMLRGRPLDLLINNAGVLGPRLQGLGHIDIDAWIYALRVNAIAPLTLIEALVESLAASQRRLVANLSSRMGSMRENDSGGYYIYRSSKAALNAVVRSAGLDLAQRGITVVGLHPGWVRTDMGGLNAELDPVDSVQRMRALLERMGPKESGGLFDLEGASISW